MDLPDAEGRFLFRKEDCIYERIGDGADHNKASFRSECERTTMLREIAQRINECRKAH